MNNETILLLLWLGITITYPMIKKGLQEMALDLTYIIMLPVGLILNLVRFVKLKINNKNLKIDDYGKR